MSTARAPKFLPLAEGFTASRMPWSVYLEIGGVNGFRPVFEQPSQLDEVFFHNDFDPNLFL